jgi:hypothetical protein
MTNQKAVLVFACAVLLCTAVPAVAQQDDDFSGEIRVGYRIVDTNGADTKYKEDINLEEGPRLFSLSFDFNPTAEGLSSMVDRIRLDVDNFGGDPFETLSLGVQKHGAFDFRYDRRKSDYFYQDQLLPPSLVDVRTSTGGDFHHFDFERVQDTARLDFQLSDRATLNFGFERFTKRGDSTTTLDIQRDEFELDKPIDESLNAYSAGFSYAWDKVTLTLEERVRDYENAVEIFLPGASEGENTTNAASLDFFFLDQPYDYKSNEHVARVVARPSDRFTVRAQALIQSLDLDLTALETSGGTGFNGSPFTTNDSGSGAIQRDADLFDVDFSYLLTDRVALVGGAYQRSLDQDGDFTFAGDGLEGAWKIDTTGAEAGVEVSATASITVSGGVRWESRDVEHDASDDTETTDHTGFFGTFAYRPSSDFTLTATVDSSSYDDPFALASPTDSRRYRVRAAYKLAGGFSLSGSYLSHTSENDDSGWEATYDQANLRFAYTASTLEASVGYALVDVERDVTRFVNDGDFVFPIFYEADTDFIDGRVRWKVNPQWVLGGSVLLYQNDGSFGLERDDVRVFVDYLCPAGYTLGVAYRTVDYSEDTYSFDDYDADIVELSIGYRW